MEIRRVCYFLSTCYGVLLQTGHMILLWSTTEIVLFFLSEKVLSLLFNFF